jgi:G3E family GTPase
MSSFTEQVPVTVLTGFLGSGKTTLLNHILTQQHGKKIAVIENEFGDVGIDDELLKKNMKEHTGEDIIEMLNGCICCTVRQDLVEVMKKLSQRAKSGLKLDGIIIETTGMADPAPVAQTFFVDDNVAEFCKLDGIVTLVDAKHIIQHLDMPRPADVENEAVEQVAFADRLILNKCDLVNETEIGVVEGRLKDINKFAPIIRSTQSLVSVDQVLNIKAFDLDRTMDINPEFLTEEHGDHEHDTSVSSCGIDIAGDVDLEMLQEWFSDLLQNKGADIYRMKGILAVQGLPQKYQFHAVHMLFSGNFGEEWGAQEPRCCRLIFIGKNLDHEELRKKFYDCLITEESRQKRLDALRFAVGTMVECRTGASEWTPGKVVDRLWVSPGGFVAPYQIELKDGTLIYAPADDNQVIRAASSSSRKSK